MLRRVHIPEMTLETDDIQIIKDAVKDGLTRWLNSATDEEVGLLNQITATVTSEILNGFVQIGKAKKVA